MRARLGCAEGHEILSSSGELYMAIIGGNVSDGFVDTYLGV